MSSRSLASIFLSFASTVFYSLARPFQTSLSVGLRAARASRNSSLKSLVVIFIAPTFSPIAYPPLKWRRLCNYGIIFLGGTIYVVWLIFLSLLSASFKSVSDSKWSGFTLGTKSNFPVFTYSFNALSLWKLFSPPLTSFISYQCPVSCYKVSMILWTCSVELNLNSGPISEARSRALILQF
jgi:hypothetical protein